MPWPPSIDSNLIAIQAHVPLVIAQHSSLGEAHAEVTNALFLHLGKPPFLMCPVEYSGNRANPSVTKSEYLATLGSKLHPGWFICQLFEDCSDLKIN